jgi:LacI family transcriptional regulator
MIQTARSLKEIAKAAGVSEATASLALNDRPGVNAKTKQRVQDLAKKRGYIPSISAQTLAKQKSALIGVIVPNIDNLIYSSFVRAIESELRQAGYKMVLATSESNIGYEQAMITHFISFRVEGVIIYPIIKDNPDPSYVNILSTYNIPLIFLGGYYRSINAPHVMSDLYSAVSQATEFLYKRGSRSFYYIGGCKTLISNVLKINGIRDTLAQKKISFDENRYIELEKVNYQYAYEAMKDVLGKTKDVDAVITGDVYTGMAVYNALREKKLKIPKDVQLISFDNIIPSGVCKIDFTCIEQNICQIVKTILEELFSKIDGREVDRNILIDTKLIERETTR